MHLLFPSIGGIGAGHGRPPGCSSWIPPGFRPPSLAVRPSELVFSPTAPNFSLRSEVLSRASSPSPAEGDFCPSCPVKVPDANLSSWSVIVQLGGNTSSPALKFFPPLSMDEDVACISPPTEIVDQGRRIWGSSLVGYFFDVPPHFKAVCAIARLLWTRLGLEHIAANYEGFFFFIFSSKEKMEQCLLAGPWLIARKAIYLKRFLPGMKLCKELHKLFLILVTFFNMPIEFSSSLGLGWVASAIGKPVQLCPRTAKIEKLDVAQICVEIDVDAALPSSIILQLSDSNPVVNVEYSWKLIRCGQCLMFGHEEPNCKAKRIRHYATKSPRNRALPKSCPLPLAFFVGVHKEVDSGNSFAPLLSGCHPEVIQDLVVKDLVVQCPQFAEQIAAVDLEETLPLVLLQLLLFLSLDDVGPVVRSQVGMHPNEASGEALIGGSKVLSIAGGMGVVDSDACLNSRNEHVLPSYSALSRVKDFGVCLLDDGLFKTSYGGVKIDGAVERGNGGVQGMDALHRCLAHNHKDLHGFASSPTVKLCPWTKVSSLKVVEKWVLRKARASYEGLGRF